MMRVTYLGHSGFLLEWPGCYWLLDWWTGELPPLSPDKPLLVFASHRHQDHFNPAVFQLHHPDIRYILSADIRVTARSRERWGVPDGADITSVRRRTTTSLEVDGQPLRVTALPSTDIGVAFLLEYQGKTVYHAGDLHWWHWAGEPESWNRNMAANYKKYLEPLRGKRLDLAFAPLDPRLEDAYDWGLAYLLETVDVGRLFPMHCWDDYDIARRFREAHPELSAPLMDVSGVGQSWDMEI